MKRILAIALLLVVPARPSAAQAVVGESNADATLEGELRTIARKRILAFDKGDTSVWSPYVDDSYLIATPSGGVRTKRQVMEGFRPPLAGYRDVFQFEDVHIRRAGDVAMMSYIIDEYEFWDDQRYDIPKLRKTDTYILRGGRWVILASQETFVPPERKTVPINPKTYDAYVGRYQLMRSLTYAVTREGDKLFMQEVGQPDRRELLPESPTVFFSRGESGEIVFAKGAKGNVTHLIIRDNNYDIKVRKITRNKGQS